ncbi:hypothetical protein H1R20_g16250, partial [Candolleomyces eurysporus]
MAPTKSSKPPSLSWWPWSKKQSVDPIGNTPNDVGSINVTTNAAPALFSNASKFVVQNLQVNASQSDSYQQFESMLKAAAGPVDPKDGWELLVNAAAPNALYNSAHRFDPPKCDEDTRVGAIEEIMDWIQDCESPQRLLCMTGAAGSGKSALQQTISERCAAKGILGTAFFFSSTDPTRNTASALIATMAYQLGSDHVELREEMGAAVAKDPLIFSKSMKTQMDNLIVTPFEHMRRNSELSGFPYAMLIDGLDECTDEKRQAEVLSTISECLIKNKNMPFRIFIASRPEWPIRRAMEEAGCLHRVAYHIQLSDKYDAFDDIKRVLWKQLREIGRKSSDPRARSPKWPSEEDIQALCVAASGQFIYAATVIKFVSDIRSSPADRLQIVLTWTPKNRGMKPFAALDHLYTRILSRAKEEYEASNGDGNDYLLLIRVYQLMHHVRWAWEANLQELDNLLGLEENAHERLLWDLHSLVTTVPFTNGSNHLKLHFYHRSFLDFLNNESRSKDLFVPENRADLHISFLCLEHIEETDLEDPAVDTACRLLGSFPPAMWPFPTSHPIFLDDGMAPLDRLEKVDRWVDVWGRHLLKREAVRSWARVLARYIETQQVAMKDHFNAQERMVTSIPVLQASGNETDELAVIKKYHEKWEKAGRSAPLRQNLTFEEAGGRERAEESINWKLLNVH